MLNKIVIFVLSVSLIISLIFNYQFIKGHDDQFDFYVYDVYEAARNADNLVQLVLESNEDDESISIISIVNLRISLLHLDELLSNAPSYMHDTPSIATHNVLGEFSTHLRRSTFPSIDDGGSLSKEELEALDFSQKRLEDFVKYFEGDGYYQSDTPIERLEMPDVSKQQLDTILDETFRVSGEEYVDFADSLDGY